MLERIFDPYRNYALFVLRLFVGVVFLGHGYMKLAALDGFRGFLEQVGVPSPAVMAPLVAAVEFFGGLALLLGAGTRVASLLLVVVMVVAVLSVTINVGFAGGYDVNLALLGGLLCLLLSGPGKPAVGGDL
jgi:uncharacterized membrane protein YphA (DoxX/SURF4 family)